MPTVVVRLVVVHAPFREYSDCVFDFALATLAWLGLAWSGSQSSSKTIGDERMRKRMNRI
jgi:hypothetical protein